MVSVVIRVQFVEFDTCFLLRAFCIFTARYVLSSLNIIYGGTKFEIFREHVGYWHFVLLRRTRLCLIKCCKSCCFLSRVSFIFVRLRQRIWSAISDRNCDITTGTLEPRDISNRASAAIGRHWKSKIYRRPSTNLQKYFDLQETREAGILFG